MTKISAKIVADSISRKGHRITTMELVFPRFILAELNTHRLFSKNSASSRAIPFEKMLKSVKEDPFIPIAWQKDHKGMQGTEYFTDKKDISWLTMNHLKARDQAVERAIDANEKGLTKQICNRYLEPFMWHKVLLTATEFENFFNLRCPQYEYFLIDRIYKAKSRKDLIRQFSDSAIVSKQFESYSELGWLSINKGQAEVHMMRLAECMYDAMVESSPKILEPGEWHIPYFNIDAMEEAEIVLLGFASGDYFSKTNIKLNLQTAQLMVSSARCARLSYETLGDDAKIDFTKDLSLHDNLLKSKHMSPFEHCAKAMDDKEYETNVKGLLFDHSSTMEGYQPEGNSLGWCKNFRGFIQYREQLENK